MKVHFALTLASAVSATWCWLYALTTVHILSTTQLLLTYSASDGHVWDVPNNTSVMIVGVLTGKLHHLPILFGAFFRKWFRYSQLS